LSKKLQHGLSKKERQVMEVIYRNKKASVADVLREIPSPPTYSTVRATLKIMEIKGLLSHRKEGRKFVYLPAIPHGKAKRSAVRQLLQTYFNDSARDAVAAIIQVDRGRLTEEDFNNILETIEKAKEEDKK